LNSSWRYFIIYSERDLDDFLSISSFRLHALLWVYLLFHDIAETFRFDADV